MKSQNQWTIIFFSDVFNDAIFFCSKRQNQWTFTFINEHITDFVLFKNGFFLGQMFTEPSHVHWVNHWKLQFNQCTLHWNKSSFRRMKKQQISFVGSNILLLLGKQHAPSSRGKTADLITDHNVEEGSNTNKNFCFWLAIIPHLDLNLGVGEVRNFYSLLPTTRGDVISWGEKLSSFFIVSFSVEKMTNLEYPHSLWSFMIFVLQSSSLGRSRVMKKGINRILVIKVSSTQMKSAKQAFDWY